MATSDTIHESHQSFGTGNLNNNEVNDMFNQDPSNGNRSSSGKAWFSGAAMTGGASQAVTEEHGAEAMDNAAVAVVGGGSGDVAEEGRREGWMWWRSQSMVWPSERWPSSRVSWKIRAAQRAGTRTLRPLPSTFLWRSLLEEEDRRERREWGLDDSGAN
ncbi:hypothetical protein U1Q18_032994 [Sarracenia purpurea var. burkii]